MTDYKIKGPEQVIAALIYTDTTTQELKTGIQVIGPRNLDGISYVYIRTDAVLDTTGTTDTGPELSDVVVGVWYDPVDISAMEASIAAFTQANEEEPKNT